MIYCAAASYFPYPLLLITTSDIQGWQQSAGKCQIIAQMPRSQTFAPDRMSLASRRVVAQLVELGCREHSSRLARRMYYLALRIVSVRSYNIPLLAT
jgi:hypothetical protein